MNISIQKVLNGFIVSNDSSDNDEDVIVIEVSPSTPADEVLARSIGNAILTLSKTGGLLSGEKQE